MDPATLVALLTGYGGGGENVKYSGYSDGGSR